jgi:hypothetical protein
MPGATPTRFAILAAQRSGSNMLCTMLGSHPDILCHHEVFNPAGIFYALHLRDGGLDLGTIDQRNRDPLGFLAKVWAADLGYLHLGLKVSERQEPEVLHALLEDRGVRKIVLVRNNRLKTLVSRKISEATGQWEVYRDKDLAPRPRVEIQFDEIQAYLAYRAAYYAEVEGGLSASGQPHLRVSYEELPNQGEQRRLLDFIGARPLALQARSVKQNSTDLRDLIANYEELAAALRGTELARELEAREE